MLPERPAGVGEGDGLLDLLRACGAVLLCGALLQAPAARRALCRTTGTLHEGPSSSRWVRLMLHHRCGA